jgi:hypothetical protein
MNHEHHEAPIWTIRLGGFARHPVPRAPVSRGGSGVDFEDGAFDLL